MLNRSFKCLNFLHAFRFISVGQIRGDVAVQMNVAASVNSDASVSNKENDEQMKYRKGAKRRIHDESSSFESFEKPRGKPVDEEGLLRRIIRSEMRKFIKVYHLYFTYIVPLLVDCL